VSIVNSYISRLGVAGLQLLLGLLWMFFGRDVVSNWNIVANDELLFWFISGMVIGLVIHAVFVFVRELLVILDFITLERDLTEKVYHDTLNENGVAIAIKDTAGRYIYVNDYFCEIFGVTKNYVAGKKDDSFMDEIEVLKCLQEDEKVLKRKLKVEHEEVVKVDGQSRYFKTTKTPLYKKGKLIGLYVVRKDNSEQKLLEKKNEELNRRYKRLFDDLPFPTMMLDVTTTLATEFNNALLDMLGYKRGEFFRTRLGLYIREEGDDTVEFINKIMEQGGGVRLIQLISKEKDIFDVEAHFKVVEQKEKKYLHVIFRDITENRQATDDLIKSKQNYYTLFNHANDAIFIIDPETMAIVDANELAYLWLGYDEGELSTLSIFDIDRAGLEKVTREKLAELSQHKDILFEHEMCTYQGDTVPVEVSAHSVIYGNKLAYQYVVRDISERKVAEWALRESEDRYWTMFESNSSIMLVLDPVRNVIEDANSSAILFYKFKREDIIGKDYSLINISSGKNDDAPVSTSAMPVLYEATHKLSDNEIRIVEVSEAPIEIHGRELCFVIVRDITDSKEVVNQLNLAERMFASSSEAAIILDSSYKIIAVNNAVIEMTGYDEEELKNQCPEIILADQKRKIFSDKVKYDIEKNGLWKGTLWNRKKSGENYPVKLHIELIKNRDENKQKYVLMMTVGNALSYEGGSGSLYLDNMIGLADKEHFIDRLGYALKRSMRSGKYIAILVIDIRRFFELNKRDGFDTGDELLKKVGKRLKFTSRDSDYVSHFGADKFAMLLEDLGDINKINIIAQKILSTLSESYYAKEEIYDLVFAVGISLFPEDGDDATDLIEKAEDALVSAKLEKESSYHLYSHELQAKSKVWWDFERRLHDALKDNEFKLFFLPQFDIENNALSAIEVLLRWDHPEKGLLEPGELLVEAENTGFIVAIGDWVIREACNALNSLQSQGYEIPELVINVSPLQIDENFLQYLQEVCNEEKVLLDKIALDMTEASLSTLSFEQIEVIEALRKNGIKFQIDDFGKGTSTISALLNIGFDRVKVDARLINQLVSSEKARKHCHMVHSMSEVLEFKIIGEGVEEENQLKELKKMKCDYAQGHLFSEALNIEELINYLKKL